MGYKTLPIDNLSRFFFRVLLSIRFICSTLLFSYANNVLAKVDIITYRGWKNCYQISNSTSKIIILPEIGGRVIAFTYNHKNIIYQDTLQNGKSFESFKKRHFDPDGGRQDYGPENVTAPLHIETWMGKWDVKSTGEYSVT